jgi:hypothetical protein
LKGKGVSPLINLSIKDGVYDFGAVIAGEYREETFRVSYTTNYWSKSVVHMTKLDGFLFQIILNTGFEYEHIAVFLIYLLNGEWATLLEVGKAWERRRRSCFSYFQPKS